MQGYRSTEAYGVPYQKLQWEALGIRARGVQCTCQFRGTPLLVDGSALQQVVMVVDTTFMVSITACGDSGGGISNGMEIHVRCG